MRVRTSITMAAGAAPHQPLTIQISGRANRALSFTCFIAELVDIPRADEHFDLRTYLFVGRAPCCSVLLPKARLALKLSE